jgi:transglutaminase-like putative cysteine protease
VWRIGYGTVFIVACLVVFFWAPARVSYRIAERYRFSGGVQGSSVRLHVFVPESGPYQSVTLQRVIWQGVWEKRHVRGLPVLFFEGEGGAATSGEAEALVEYAVTVRQGMAEWAGASEASDLAPAEGIESDHPSIREKAAALAGGEASARRKAYRIYRFVAGYLRWPKGTRTGVTSSAVTAYKTGVGVCEDFAGLTVALCRASGIPARVVSGLAFAGVPPVPLLAVTRKWGHPAGAHAWVELHDGSRWLMADPSWASAIAPRLHFGRNDGMHLSYGSAPAAKRAYEEVLELVRSRGAVVGAMSAPLRFVAGASFEGVTIVPEVTVQTRWDGRLANTVLTAVFLGWALPALGRRFERRRAGGRTRKR